MKRLLVALCGLALTAGLSSAGIQELTDIGATIEAAEGDQHRLDAREMRAITIYGHFANAAGTTCRIGLYQSVDGTNWKACISTLGADSAFLYTAAISAVALRIVLPLPGEYWAGGSSFTKQQKTNYARLKIVVTNTGASNMTSNLWYVVYE